MTHAIFGVLSVMAIFHQLPAAALLLAHAEALLVGYRRRSSDVIARVRSDVSRCIQLEAWPAIRRARRGIREIVRQRIPHAEVYSSQGATAISSGYLGFCIRTKTDKERDLLRWTRRSSGSSRML